MAIVFDEITGSVQPNEPPESGDQMAAPAPAQELKPATIKRAMIVIRQRENRLRAS